MLTPAEWSAIRVSLFVAGAALAAALPVGILLGWLLARRRFPGKVLVEAVVLLPLVLPPVVTGYFLLLLFGTQGPVGRFLLQSLGFRVVFGWAGMVLAAAAVGIPFLVRSVRLSMEAVDPGLEAAARTLGAGPWRVFRTVTLPLAFPGILAGAVLAFTRALGEFGATVMVAPNVAGSRTLALEIYRQAVVPGGEAAVMRLVGISIALSLAALLSTEWLAKRGRGKVSP